MSKFLMSITRDEEEGEKGKFLPVLSALRAALLTRSIYQLCLKVVCSTSHLGCVIKERYSSRSHELDLTNRKPLTETLLLGYTFVAGLSRDAVTYFRSTRAAQTAGSGCGLPLPCQGRKAVSGASPEEPRLAGEEH